MQNLKFSEVKWPRSDSESRANIQTQDSLVSEAGLSTLPNTADGEACLWWVQQCPTKIQIHLELQNVTLFENRWLLVYRMCIRCTLAKNITVGSHPR